MTPKFPLNTHFEELLKQIQPPEARIKMAQSLPRKVRKYIKESQDFPTKAPHNRLVGSYAQHMVVGEVKDVDILVRVSGDPEANEPEAKQLIQDLKKLLDDLPAYLGYEGNAEAQIGVERARRSIHVYFKDEDFHLDVVPCIAPDGFKDILHVPDRGFNKWIASHPIGYIKLLNKLNKQHSKKIKPLGKLLKHFRNYQMINRRPKSYWLGALLVHHIDSLNTDACLGELFHQLLDGIYCQYDHLLWTSDIATPDIPDPVLEHNVSWNWSRTHFETFMRRIDEGRNRAKKALETNDRDEAIKYWQKIFGDEYFPSEVTKEASSLASKAFPGKSFVSPTGLIRASKPTSVLCTATQQTKFHGIEQN